MNWIKKLFAYKTEKHHPVCSEDCPKGGECPRLLCSDFSGKIWVEDLFKCAHVQKQVMDLKDWINLHKTEP